MVLAEIFEQLDALPNSNLIVCADRELFDELNDPQLQLRIPSELFNQLENGLPVIVPPLVFTALKTLRGIEAEAEVVVTTVQPVKAAFASLVTSN